MFAEFVRSGDLSPEDVVYDATTREWAPARTHPVVLQIELEAEEAARRSAGDTSGPEDREAHESSATGSANDLELAPEPAGPTPEEEAAAFVAQMEAERAAERDEGVPGGALKREKGSSSIVEDIAPPPAEPATAPRWQPPRAFAARPPAEPIGPSVGTRRETAIPAQATAARRRARRVGRRYVSLVFLAVAVVAAAIYLGPELVGIVAGGGTEAPPETVTEVAPPPLIADNEDALRARARERFLSSTQAELRGLDPIPEIWLRGAYLAEPSAFPRVREVWEEYLTTIRQVRAGDNDRYREAYLRALDDARVQGAARTLRLAGATADFELGGGSRAAHYDRVEALATAALQGHDALVEAEGTIAYQPAAGPGVSGDPVIEAVGRGPEAQALLNQVLDLILVQLHAEQGPGESANVREWAWDGLLDAVTS
jgi:hypothetical protein